MLSYEISELKFHKKSRELEIVFSDDRSISLSFEFLRVFSPSAEVRGHSEAQAKIQTGCRDIGIEKIEPVGQYALQLEFSDGHNTGIYSWDYLSRLANEKDALWRQYLDALMDQGLDRDQPMKNENN